MTEQLKPCPFCGKNPVLGGPDNPASEYFVYCSCDLSSMDKMRSIEKWNTRAPQEITRNKVIEAAKVHYDFSHKDSKFDDLTEWAKCISVDAMDLALKAALNGKDES